MKKYIGFLVVFALVFIGNINANAENTGTNIPGIMPKEADRKIEFRNPPPLMQDQLPKEWRNPQGPNLVNEKRLNEKRVVDYARPTEDRMIRPETEMTEEQKIEMKNKIESMRENSKTKMESLKESLKKEKNETKSKIKGQRLENREKILAQFDNNISKTFQFKNKLKDQITKLSALGIDVTQAKTHLTNSENKLSQIETKVAEMHVLLTETTDELKKTNKTKLTTLSKEVHLLLKEAQKDLNEGVKVLKEEIKAKGVMGDTMRNNDNNSVKQVQDFAKPLPSTVLPNPETVQQ